MIPARYKKLRYKVLSLLGGGILSVGLIAIYSFIVLSDDIDQFNSLMSNEVNAAGLANNMNLNFKRQVQEWKNVLLRGHNSKDREKYWQRFNNHHHTIQSQTDKFLALNVAPQLREDMQQFQRIHMSLLPQYQEGFRVFMQSNFDYKGADKVVRGIDREPTKVLEKLSKDLNSAILKNSAAYSKGATSSVMYGSFAIVIAIMVSMLITLIFMNKKVVHPITLLIEHLGKVSKGNFNDELAFYRSDEIGSMSKATEVLRQKLSGICSEMSIAEGGLKQVCLSLTDSANAINQGVAEQNKETDMVSDSMQSMVEMAEQISTNAGHAADAATHAEHSASQSIAFMQETINTITDSSTQIKDTARVIAKLDDDAKSIGTVLDVIKSIAEQTNLLALNAAIEAARAGDQGRGFAVVADEVRTLAARTQQSTEEIQQMIVNVQIGAQEAVKAIEQGEKTSLVSVQKVHDADDNLKSITSAITTISDLNNGIANAILQQSNVAQGINSNLQDLREIAKLNEAHARSCQNDNQTLSQMESVLASQIALLMGKHNINGKTQHSR